MADLASHSQAIELLYDVLSDRRGSLIEVLLRDSHMVPPLDLIHMALFTIAHSFPFVKALTTIEQELKGRLGSLFDWVNPDPSLEQEDVESLQSVATAARTHVCNRGGLGMPKLSAGKTIRHSVFSSGQLEIIVLVPAVSLASGLCALGSGVLLLLRSITGLNSLRASGR